MDTRSPVWASDKCQEDNSASARPRLFCMLGSLLAGHFLMSRGADMRRLTREGPAVLVLLLSAFSVFAQNPARSLLVNPIDETTVVSTHGTVHPLAQAQYDVGPVADSFFISRMLLLLQRPAEREADLRAFLHDSQNRRSASYHRWITPQQFGERFGPADADIQVVTAWLQSYGLKVGRLTSSKTLIEFSGTAGQLRDAFHTDIHQYTINGETHYANADEVRIPKALAAVVRGVSPLHDFRAKPLVRSIGPATYFPSKNETRVQWTIPNPNGSGNFYALAPEDFATQYDLLPLYQSSVNGTGQIIGIINESNIDVSLVNGFRQLFNLSANQPQVVIDGSDHGGSFPSNVEAFLDVEVSGAVAPEATINLYISDGGTLFDPLIFAALRALEDDQAGVLSVSFGSCEQSLGQNGNQIYASLWQQAAAQGQTVLVSAGDSGSAVTCPPFLVHG
ncbi:MAG: protease pro-enzyme activation domain-containing protein [Terriglobales bacterium]